jgi:hypothetical protein
LHTTSCLAVRTATPESVEFTVLWQHFKNWNFLAMLERLTIKVV